MSVSNLYFAENRRPACRVLLVRHPESESNRVLHRNPHATDSELTAFKDPGVTPLGETQADRTALHLAGLFQREGVAANDPLVLSSSQARAWCMAAKFLKANRDMDDSKELRERHVDHAIYEYRRPGKGALVVDDGDGERTYPEDSEWSEFVDRVDTWRRETLQSFAAIVDTTIVVFGHSVFFSTLMCLCTTDGRWRPPSVDRLPYHFPNASITHLAYNGAQWSVLYTGAIGHLLEEERTGHHTAFY